MSNSTTLLQVEWWHLLTFAVGLFLSFIAAVWAGAMLFLRQNEARISERFGALEKALKQQADNESRILARVPDLERELLEFKAQMPDKYVRRDDYIRGQSVLESKIDALAVRLDLARQQGKAGN